MTTGGQHNRGEDYAKVLCCCGYRIVTMSWDDYRNNVTPLCEHPDCDHPNRERTRTLTERRAGATARCHPTRR
jgi:hypothetical protein